VRARGTAFSSGNGRLSLTMAGLGEKNAALVLELEKRNIALSRG